MPSYVSLYSVLAPNGRNCKERHFIQLLGTARLEVWGKTVTYIRVTRNSIKIPILNSDNTVVYLTQVNEGNSISFIYTIGFYRCFGIHSVISLLFT